MVAITARVTAPTATGDTITSPPHVDPMDWADFARHVAVTAGCHIWTGPLIDGYGRWDIVTPAETLFGPGTQTTITRAHRYAYAAFHGTIPAGMLVRHRCHEPLCVPVTPAAIGHLELGDAYDNAQDSVRAGRRASNRHGVKRYGADTRSPMERARAKQAAITAAIADGAGPARLLGALRAAQREGDPHRGQLTLPLPARRLYVVR